jgi:hypothetical protein
MGCDKGDWIGVAPDKVQGQVVVDIWKAGNALTNRENINVFLKTLLP